MLRRMVILLIVLIAGSANAGGFDFTPREFNVYLSGGKNPPNVHGHSRFRSIHFEVAGQSAFLRRWIPRSETGASVSFSYIHQPRSWFGYRFGDPDGWVRALSTFFFVRRRWRQAADTQPFMELGTGPMWSNREVPAATARLNFNSQLGFGAVFFSHSRVPLHAGYRFSHISNGLYHERNPGLNVHSLVVGVRVRELRSASRR